ncbi:MAG: hypothetical protein CMM91_01085 [Rickettsiales bacterium]|nr:hypothetical protein [Rickettsiales bacterium]OUV54811.1 MAG: hypothetical protein CBC87_00525 [Rickettsiales bacterium TMED127]
MKNKKVYFEICIIGSGLIGLVMALMLSKLNLKILLIDKTNVLNKKKKHCDGRTTAISQGTKRIFDSLGFWKRLELFAQPIKKILVYDEISESLEFDSKMLDEGPLGYIIQNNILKQSLLEEALRSKNIDFLENTEVININFYDEKNKVEVITEKRKITSKLVIGCDGRNSKSRYFSNLKSFEYKYLQNAYVFNISHEKDHFGVALERFFPAGPLAILPMKSSKKNSFNSSVVWTVDYELGDFSKLTKNEFKLEFLNRYQNFLGNIMNITDPNVYPLNVKYSYRCFRNNFVLIGDASQAIHPIAGQGFNLGVRDCDILLKNINQAMLMKKEIGSLEVLSKFSRQRSVDRKLFINATHNLNLFFSNNNKFLKGFRKMGISILQNSKFIKNQLMMVAMGLK